MNRLFFSVFLLLTVLLLLFACVPVSPDEDAPSASAQDTVFSVFCVFSDDGGRFSADGSAVLLAEDAGGSLLVTSFHVVHTTRKDACREQIYLHPYGKETEAGIPAECVWEAPDCDLALLRTEVSLGTPPTAASTLPDSADPVWAFGNGGGMGVRGKEGSGAGQTTVTLPVDYRTEPLTLPLLSFAATLAEGDSGGGLFDEDGNLLGIINAMRADSAVGYAIPVSYANDMLWAYRQNKHD